MKLAVGLLILLVALPGCRTKPKQSVPPWGAFPPVQHPPPPQINQQLGVTFQGPVRHPVIPWRPDLTLALALVEAEYVGARDPQSIVIFRGDKAILVEPRHLLSGIKDPPLLPADVVELRQ